MKRLKVIHQKGTTWTDAEGISLPTNRITAVEKLKEKLAGSLLKGAIKIHGALLVFRKEIEDAFTNLAKAQAAANKAAGKKAKATKGNFTFFNFDRSIKIEVNVQESIVFDEAMIAAAKELFNTFLNKSLGNTEAIVRELINSAFVSSRNGNLDTKKVMSLLKYREKVKNASFQEALNLIETAISRPSSKRYFRIWAKDTDGQYQNIGLDFSSLAT